MKRLYILLLSLLIISCSNDDDSTNNSLVDLQGEWNLVNIIGGFEGIDQDFERGTIIWDFNETDGTITVTNNSTITDVYNGLPSGTYDYSVMDSGGSDELIVNDINLGTFTVTSINLTIIPQFRDGFEIRFDR
ncbi:hypothetical protein [Aquimarina rubra]|uniref:Lipocalin-like domain-containing protein n=1 Tax=Aquimarina rubra TaxID=1920033 RepID=A0ABW5LB31_9FLAO